MSNDTQVPTLTEFLLARIAEDEAVARGAEDVGRWSVRSYLPSGVEGEVYVVSDDGPNDSYGAVCGAESDGYHSTVEPGNATHIARHDPARVLAECAAKRRIVDAFEDERQRMDIYNRDYPLGLLTTDGDLRARLSANARWAGLDVAVRALVQPYADHPDYQQEWKP